MKKLLLGAAALLTVAAPLTLAAAPANANTASIPQPVGGTATLTVGDVTYGADGECRYAPVTVSIDVPDDYAYADFEYTSTYDGPTTLSDEIWGNEEWSGTYTHEFMVCPEYDDPGYYTGYLDVTFYDYDDWYGDYVDIASAHVTDSFRVSAYTPPAPDPAFHTSSLTTTKVPTGAHGWMLRTVNRYDDHAWVGHRVNLQRKDNGSWRTIKSVWTNTAGRADLAFTPTAGRAKAYRTVSVAGPGVNAKVSPTYSLRRR